MSPKVSDRSAASGAAGTNYYPKKYWWAILIVVPLAGALIQYRPWTSASGTRAGSSGVSDNQFNAPAIVGDVSVVINEAAKAGTTLDEGMIKLIKEAAGLSTSGQHGEAAAKIEQVRSSSPTVANLPSLLNGVGAEQLAAGNTEEARKAFDDAIAKDPTNRLAWEGLRRLPENPIKGVKVVNYSSQYFYGLYPASALVDGNPATSWSSADGTFPQSFVLELPIGCEIVELSFNNVSGGAPGQASKDIEISVSADSATAGFAVVAKTVLAEGEIGQGIRLKPAARGRWIKLRILSNHGDHDHTQLGDVQISGKPLAG